MYCHVGDTSWRCMHRLATYVELFKWVGSDLGQSNSLWPLNGTELMQSNSFPLSWKLWALGSSSSRRGDDSKLLSQLLLGDGPFGKLRPLTSGHWELRATSRTSQEPRPWDCKSPRERVQRPSQNTSKLMYVVWSRTLKCSVKSYVIGPSTQYYFNEYLFMRVLTHDKIE